MPTTPHSNATHIEPNQIQLDLTANEAWDILDESTHALLEIELTTDDLTLSNTEIEQSGYLRVTGAFTANRTLTLPNNDDLGTAPRPKKIAVEHGGSGGFTLTVETVDGTGIEIQPGNTQALYCDGVDVVAQGPATTTTAPYDVVAFVAGLPDAGALVGLHRFARAVEFAEDLPDSQGYCLTTSTGNVSFDVKKQVVGGALTTPGTVDFAIGENEATFTWAADVSFAVGDVMLLYAPGSQDATLADVAITIAGTRA